MKSYPMVEEFVSFKKQLNRKDKTVDEYVNSINKFNQYIITKTNKSHLTRMSYGTISKMDVQDYAIELRKNLSIPSVQKELAGLNQFYGFLEANQIVKTNIAKGIQIPKNDINPEKIFMEIWEGDKMFDGCENLRDKIIIGLGNYNGLRINEVASLKVENLNLAKGTMTFMRKNSKVHTLPISKHILPLLIEYVGDRKTGSLVGIKDNMIHKMFKAEAEKHGFTDEGKYSFHTFRACCASRLYKNGMQPFEIQKFLNHSTVDTTYRYLNISKDDFMTKFADI